MATSVIVGSLTEGPLAALVEGPFAAPFAARDPYSGWCGGSLTELRFECLVAVHSKEQTVDSLCLCRVSLSPSAFCTALSSASIPVWVYRLWTRPKGCFAWSFVKICTRHHLRPKRKKKGTAYIKSIQTEGLRLMCHFHQQVRSLNTSLTRKNKIHLETL